MRALWYLTALGLLTSSCTAKRWSPAIFPDPSTASGARACGRDVQRSAICDPDGVISVRAANTVEGIIKDIEAAKNPYRPDLCPKSREIPGYQIAVAMMEQMMVHGDASIAETAASFATELFEKWGVGDPDCNNGVLLLLSKLDRQVYIRAGQRALEVAPESKLGTVISGMRPLLREGDYDAAVKRGVVDLGLVLAGANLDDDSGSGWDGGIILFWVIIGAIVSFVLWSVGKKESEQRRCRKLLDKLRAEQTYAQRHKSYPAKSCPICFEDLKATTGERPSSEQQKHSEAGPSESAGGSLANPLLQKHAKQSNDFQKPASKQNKSEGKKRLTLPCGHTFCDSCMERWLDKHDSCPICRTRLGEGEGAPRPPPCTSRQTAQLDPDMYAMEVNYRMQRLHRWYPYWVTPMMLNDSEEATRRGEIVDWNAVRAEQLSANADAQHESAGTFGSSHSFGGGTSAGGGGAGGSW